MKMDKETLIKHRFWVGLGVYTPLWLIALIYILVAGSSQVSKGRDTIKGANTQLDNINNPKNKSFFDPIDDRKNKLAKQKNTVWGEAWGVQGNFMTWPPGIPIDPKKKYDYFGEEIGPEDRMAFHTYYKKQEEQFRTDQAKVLNPIQADWDTLIHAIPFDTREVPSTEEIWLAQEDYWVRRELFEIIRKTQEFIGKFENLAEMKQLAVSADDQEVKAPEPDKPAGTPSPAAPEDKSKEKKLHHLRYRNPLWQLDLYLGQDDKKVWFLHKMSTLTNVCGERVEQILTGQEFVLKQTDSSTGANAVKLVFQEETPGMKIPYFGKLSLKDTVLLPRFTNTSPWRVELGGEAFQGPPGAFRRRYRSPNWELDLLFETDSKGELIISPRSTLTNINSAHGVLRVNNAQFRVSQGTVGTSDPIILPKEFLLWGKANAMPLGKPFSIRGLDRDKPILVEQVFNWNTSPIKRIKEIALYHSNHKFAYYPLTHAEQFPKPKAEETTTTSTNPMMGPMTAMKSGPPGIGGNQPSTNSDLTEKYQLERNRYLSASAQARRMPVAMSVVIDQAYMQDLQTAFINSRLRMQITQVQYQRTVERARFRRGEQPRGYRDNAADGPRVPNLSTCGAREADSSCWHGRPDEDANAFAPHGGIVWLCRWSGGGNRSQSH